MIRNDGEGKKYLYDIVGIKKEGGNYLPTANNSSDTDLSLFDSTISHDKSVVNTSIREKGEKYFLSTYEQDAGKITTERREEIDRQFENDKAVIPKPTKMQLWGEGAEWVAHNMSRVFPDIPERGADGAFFAEFRKMMIQWKALPKTAMFMTENNLYKMTENLTPDEYKTFGELVYFLDLQEEAQIQKERGYEDILLPNEINY